MALRFIDRQNDRQTLQNEYDRQGSSFVVVYGRRRVGKTSLLSEFAKDKKHIYFLATEESDQQNLDAFRRLTAQELDNPLLAAASLEQWEPVFSVITEAAATEKLLLILDEFQYLGKANTAFPSILMRIWDNTLKDTNIMLILCGSLINMMTAQVLSYDSPLYGRRTAQIRMTQIPFSYYYEFMPSKTEDELILNYAVTGGVPKYIELFTDTEDIYSAISRHILNQNSFLYAEPEFLLGKEVSEIGSYFSILKTIAAGSRKLSEIASRIEVRQTSLTRYLKTLADLDLVEREVPVTEENAAKSKSGQYRIKDNFIRFWFLFVYPYRNLLETGQEAFVDQRIRQHLIDSHVSYVYEAICREKLWERNGEFAEFDRVGRWWNKDTEIDIVAYHSAGKDMLFGECKYSVQPKGIDVLVSLRKKAILVPWNKDRRTEWYVLFSRSGFTDELQQLAATDGHIRLYTTVGS